MLFYNSIGFIIFVFTVFTKRASASHTWISFIGKGFTTFQISFCKIYPALVPCLAVKVTKESCLHIFYL